MTKQISIIHNLKKLIAVYDFKNKAIECSAWEQMLKLIEIAEGQGIQRIYNSLNSCKSDFDLGERYFALSTAPEFWNIYDRECEPITVSFTDFIAQHTPDVDQIVASINIH